MGYIYFFSLFDILDLRLKQLFPKKISKIKIFIKSNQFLFNIIPHDDIKTYSVNHFTIQQSNTTFCWSLPFEVYIVYNMNDRFSVLFQCHFYVHKPSFSYLVFHSLLTKGILLQQMHLHSNHRSFSSQGLL